MTAKTTEPALMALSGPEGARVCAPEAFSSWISGARAGETFLYAEAKWLPKAAKAPVLDLVRASHDAGELLLFQRRVEPGRYQYLAVRRARRLRPAVKFLPRGLAGQPA